MYEKKGQSPWWRSSITATPRFPREGHQMILAASM